MKLLLEAFQMAMAAWSRAPTAGILQAQVPSPLHRPFHPLTAAARQTWATANGVFERWLPASADVNSVMAGMRQQINEQCCGFLIS